ncbi:MAG TPA: SDR family oxidoreductase, partial [Polyangiaceae bacterium]|nr:SDR family oxidoreductase [Polyangiaceae bacterium]
MTLDPDDIVDCLRVLETLVEDRARLAEVERDTRSRLLVAAGRLSRPERAERQALARALRRKEQAQARVDDRALLARAGIRQKRLEPVFVTPGQLELGETRELGGDAEPVEVKQERACYVCKDRYTRLHFFYDQMCEPCGDYNYAKRSQSAALSGRVALITGARVKIGYQAAILLLRAGARVVVTTRFPRDAALRFSREADHAAFCGRLSIYGLDLRHTPSVEAFAKHLNQHEDRLDFVLHNACQTVRRPSGFYRHLMDAELAPFASLPADARALLGDYEAMRAKSLHTLESNGEVRRAGGQPLGMLAAPSLSQVSLSPDDEASGQGLFPVGQLDADLQQVDLRDVNSWRLALDQVGTVELLEVQLVNAIAPFVLNARLKPLLLRQRTFDKHIVNVSAMEGQFYRRFKTDKHPHTNMAKAALNMMTRTSAADFVKDGIHMNSVDTGWVTDEDP